MHTKGEKRVQSLWHYASANVIKFFSNQYSSALPGPQTPQGYNRAMFFAASPKSSTFLKTGEQQKLKTMRAIRNILGRSRLVGSRQPLLQAL